jgi:alkylglycerol monooxygenase
MFGTFEWERKDEKTVYGLVDQPQFFDPWQHQIFYYGKIWEKVQSMDNLSDKISAIVKGPGWFPGTPRLGDLEMVPEVMCPFNWAVLWVFPWPKHSLR